MSDETVITGKVVWATDESGVPGAILSIYTLIPAGLVGRAEANEAGEYWMKAEMHWTRAVDLYVVVLNRRGELLQVVREGSRWLTGSRTRLDVTVTGRWRSSGPRRTGQQRSAENTDVVPTAPGGTKCVVPTPYWPKKGAPEFLGGGRGVRRRISNGDRQS
ncbi:MAG TPA: hypothetical protein VK733_12635 [Gemmatimonadaceae bacterium]|jgi:hypothetical protein|nr:hypothetical protein [Gemmatimonadaceae bacterium]